MGAQQADANGFWQDDTTLANIAIRFDNKQGSKNRLLRRLFLLLKQRTKIFL